MTKRHWAFYTPHLVSSSHWLYENRYFYSCLYKEMGILEGSGVCPESLSSDGKAWYTSICLIPCLVHLCVCPQDKCLGSFFQLLSYLEFQHRHQLIQNVILFWATGSSMQVPRLAESTHPSAHWNWDAECTPTHPRAGQSTALPLPWAGSTWGQAHLIYHHN